VMAKRNLLKGKRVLAVDDEPDVLEALEELLHMCTVVKASTFSEAKDLLENKYFDIVILDIMGVDGYKLLDIAKERGMVAVMLTAHALTPENIVRSYKEGAASFFPKERITEIPALLNDVLESLERGKSPWLRWLDRWVSFYDDTFGPDWKNKDKEFWEDFGQWD
jgi:DNA-binding NtrC family response regulator